MPTEKTCCGIFTWDDLRKCWMYPSGQEIKTRGEALHCYKCGRKLTKDGKMKKMVEAKDEDS